MLGMPVSSHTSISFDTGGDLHVMYMSQKNKVIFYMTRILMNLLSVTWQMHTKRKCKKAHLNN